MKLYNRSTGNIKFSLVLSENKLYYTYVSNPWFKYGLLVDKDSTLNPLCVFIIIIDKIKPHLDY